MTKEESIKILKSKMDGHTDTSYEWAETVRMAIEALEQKGDFESKQRIIDAITAKIDEIDDEKPDVIIGLITAIGVIKNLPDTTESEGYMKSALTDIGKAIMNLIEEYDIAKDNEYVRKPISYALYHTWRRWDEKEKPRNVESEESK
jgi:hypothetical protein